MPNSSAESDESATRLRFPRWRRLRTGAEYQRVYALRQRAGDGLLLVFAAPNELGYTRVGLSVSRKQGNSVVRHRLRRRLREAYRLEQHGLPEGLDLVLIPGREMHTAPLEAIRASLARLVARAAGPPSRR